MLTADMVLSSWNCWLPSSGVHCLFIRFFRFYSTITYNYKIRIGYNNSYISYWAGVVRSQSSIYRQYTKLPGHQICKATVGNSQSTTCSVLHCVSFSLSLLCITFFYLFIYFFFWNFFIDGICSLRYIVCLYLNNMKGLDFFFVFNFLSASHFLSTLRDFT